MSLPDIDIPFTLPFDIPLLSHPPIVHFAIALPILILFLEAANLFMKRRAVSVISFSFLTLLIIVLFGAYFAGKVDGKNAIDLMSSDAEEILKEHKLLGTYLVYGSIVLLILKLLSITKVGALKVLYMLSLIGFIAATVHQGEEGGELVYEHGTNVERANLLDDKVFDLEEQVDELKAKIEELTPAPVSEETPAAEATSEEANTDKAASAETAESNASTATPAEETNTTKE